MRLPSYDTAGLLYEGQDGSRVLSQDAWDDVLGQVCVGKAEVGFLLNYSGAEWLKRRMMRDVTVKATDHIYRALVNEGVHSVLGRIEEPGPTAANRGTERAKFKLSEEALAFTKAWVERLTYPLKSVCHDLLEAKFFGHKLCEIDYFQFSSDLPKFKNVTLIVPIDLSPKPRTVYRFKVDKGNRIEGVVPDGANADAIVPVNNILTISMGGMDRDPRGDGLAPYLYESVESRRRSRLNQAKASDQTGGGFVVVEEAYPKTNADGSTELYDAYVEVPDGLDAEGKPKTKQMSRQKLTGAAIATASTGKAASLLPGQTVKVVQGDGATIFDAILDRDDRDIAKIYLGAARMLNEAQNGSKADTGVAENVGETIRDADRGLLCGVIEDLFRRVLQLNFGNKYDGVSPRYDIVTEEGNDFAAIVTAILNPEFKALPVVVQNYIASKGGIPEVFEEQEEVLPTDEQDPEQIDKEDREASDKEVAAFVAGFLPRG